MAIPPGFGSSAGMPRAIWSRSLRKPATETRPGDTSDGYFQEFNLELLERDGDTLREINDALGRIESGTYGQCENCQELIFKERLKAVPHARYCIECQRKSERDLI